MSETVWVEIPGGTWSEDRSTIGVGFPEGVTIPSRVSACGDGVHVFKPMIWDNDDPACMCGDIAPGWPILRLPAIATIVIPDVAVEREEPLT